MKITYIYSAVVVLIIGGLIAVKIFSGSSRTEQTTIYDSFAQCLSDAGAKYYGAYWCPRCKEQEELFNNSKKLPYIECSTPNGQNQTKICIDEKITGYPTWKFSDDSILDGVQQLTTLAEKTNCELPAQ